MPAQSLLAACMAAGLQHHQLVMLHNAVEVVRPIPRELSWYYSSVENVNFKLLKINSVTNVMRINIFAIKNGNLINLLENTAS